MLKVDNLSCERDRRLLFSGLGFSLKEGEILQIAGGNGVGKTTLLKILTGLYSDFEGSVAWDLGSAPLYIGHKLGVHSQLTVMENWRWYVSLYDGQEALFEEAAKRLSLVGYEEARCDQLSEGQLKRVALGRLIFCPQRCWILDEPFSALDKAGIATVEDCLDAHVEQRGSVILTNHQNSVEGEGKTLLELGR